MADPISLATALAGVSLESCVYNASGPLCSSAAEMQAIGASDAGAVLSKSATLEKRAGNEMPRYAEMPWGSINSMGLPNEGYAFYAAFAEQAQAFGKPYFISVAGLSPQDNVHIVKELARYDGVAAIELNLSCPNLPGKPQTGYDFENTRPLLDMVLAEAKQPLGVKLPPYFDMPHFDMMAAVLNDFPLAFVTCINSVGNGLVVDPQAECAVIKPKGGFGGLGGDFIKPTALANVRKFRTLLKKEISVIGVGGIKTGMDAFEHILCGASAVQIGTQFMREGVGCFARIAAELREIMRAKGYADIESFRGRLKTL
ncbi:MAG: dihydroorotate oxidase [Rhodospirillales bacterium]|nr:dihydroorotate oxidase [Alphaproteobacteria bacterium]MCB9986694.1 dihydroorotate oxidase [Rhodospirillales bacterium]USO06781.1 MAG: dihydroorotate oxidase [Rhodospirillales bacterium]